MIDVAEIMNRAKSAFEKSGMTLDELGKRMGANPDTARNTAWQFLKKTTDPRVSMLIKFCEAVGMPIDKFFAEKRIKKK